MFWLIPMHYITLYVIEILNIRCLGPFLPLYVHIQILRFLGVVYYFALCWVNNVPYIGILLNMVEPVSKYFAFYWRFV